MTDLPVRIAFVCVRNAGRSQMAAGFAERERVAQGLEGVVEIVSGGTEPADRVHDAVVEAMREVDVDLSNRTPRALSPADAVTCDLVVTMGCDAADVCPATWHGESRDWDLENPHGSDFATVRAVRDEIERRVGALFDELTAW